MAPSPRSRRRVAPAVMAVTALGTFALAAPPAQAEEIAVPCDSAALVQAVAAATATPEPDTLSLTPNCVYTLTAPADVTSNTGLPIIRGKLTLNGNHATIGRAKEAPPFRIMSNRGELDIKGLTITGGHASDGVGTDAYGEGKAGESGGGIQNWGPLTITDSVITGNTSGSGAPGADATSTSSAGRGGGGGFGGGIASYISTQATLTITDSLITGNATGAGGRGGNGTGAKPGGRGGSGGFGAGVDVLWGTVLRLNGSAVTGNVAGDGGRGGDGGAERGGGGDGGSGGTGAGVMTSADAGKPLNPVIAGTEITGNQAGRGGDAGVAGPGGYSGYAGFGGSGGGLSVFHETLTFDAGTVSDNAAGEPGSGSFPLPASGGGIYTLDGHVTLANGAVVSGNRPDNCHDVAEVPGCVNDFGVAVARHSGAAGALAVAEQAVVSAISVESSRE